MAILHSVRLVEVALFLHYLGVSTLIILEPYLFVSRFSKEFGLNGTSTSSIPCHNVSDDQTTLQKRVESHAARWSYYINGAASIPSLLLSIVMGKWSDRYGRRPILLLGMFGTVVNYIVILLYELLELPMYTLPVAYFVSGIVGGRLSTAAVMLAYIVDNCDAKSRTLRLAIAEGLFSVTNCVGSGVGGVVARYYGLTPLAVFILTVEIVAFLYVLLFLRESDRSSSTKRGRKDKEGLLSLFREMALLCLGKSSYRRQLWVLILSFLLLETVYYGATGIDLLYLRLQPFCMASDFFGYLMIFKNICRTLFTFGLLPLLIKYARLRDYTLAQMGTITFLLSRLAFAFSNKVYMIFLVLAVSMPITSSPGIFRAMMSKLVHSSQQGTLLTFVAALEMLFGFLGSLAYNNCFSYFVEQDLPVLKESAGYTYFVMTAVLSIASVLLGYAFCLSRSAAKHQGYQRLDTAEGDEGNCADEADGSQVVINKAANR